jgi:hypothetical protein
MSPGDRAALEGLVSVIKPPVAIEIGTAQGGSLERLAAHSGVVHAFDVEAPATCPANAHFHLGDSAETMPRFLAELAEPIDFVLVDGDHSYAGTRRDLLALLDSELVRRTVILAHDSLYGAVRAAIASVADHPKLTFCDIDFIPGRITDGGFFSGQMWGGFALLLVGYARPHVEIFGSEITFRDAHATALEIARDTRTSPLRRLLGKRPARS